MRTSTDHGHSHEYQRNWNMTSYVENRDGDIHCHTIVYLEDGSIKFSIAPDGHTHDE